MSVEFFDEPDERPEALAQRADRCAPRQKPVRTLAQLHSRLAVLLTRLAQESRSIEAAQSELLRTVTEPLTPAAAHDLQHLDAMTQMLDDIALVCDALAADPTLSDQLHGAAPLRAAKLERTAAALFGAA